MKDKEIVLFLGETETCGISSELDLAEKSSKSMLMKLLVRNRRNLSESAERLLRGFTPLRSLAPGVQPAWLFRRPCGSRVVSLSRLEEPPRFAFLPARLQMRAV